MGKAYANRKPEVVRPANDFYETPSLCTIELIKSGKFVPTSARIYDPCCGKYAIGKVLYKYGYENVKENDIIYGNDFLKEDDKREYDAIIINPPFKLFDPFIEKAKKKAWKVFSIGKMNYFGAHSRNVNGLWEGLEWVLPFDRMIAYDQPEDEEGKISVGMMVSGWFCWNCEYEGLPRIKVLDVQKYIRSKK